MFRVGMKLEAKDRQNPSRICVATIADIQNQMVLVHLDGYATMYDYWCDPDSTDIHPVGSSLKAKKELQPPRGFDH